MPSFSVILPAAGLSSRYGGPRSKLLEPLAGEPVIAHGIAAFLARPDVAQVILATRGDTDLLSEAGLTPILKDPRVRVCLGGPTRAESVRNALHVVHPSVDWVAVHDAARPLVTQRLIDRTLAAAVEHGCAVPAMPVALTIKQAKGPLPARAVRTVPRQELFAMQTPQIMRRTDLAAAIAHCPLPLDQVTDDAQLIELAGLPVWLVPGEERNLKITTPIDLRLAELHLTESR
jgi:2-C-methyl-D-erythritol 4-phosphate cytidylyltransferase